MSTALVRVLGSELRVGMLLHGQHRIVEVCEYHFPAKLLHESVAAEHPDGLPGRIVNTIPSCRSQSVFDRDFYEVIR